MSTTRTASEQITEEVSSWPGVEAGLGRPGRGEEDVRGATTLLRLNYDRAVERGGLPAGTSP